VQLKRILLATLTTAAFILVGVNPVTGAEPANQVPCSDPRGCPDLIVDPDTMAPAKQHKDFKPQSCVVQEGMVPAGERDVLFFTFTTPNFGDGDLIVGSPDAHPEWFEWGECHGHWHFRDYADYRVWTMAGYAEWDTLRKAHPDQTASEVLAANPQLLDDFKFGGKRGFCVIDVVLYTIPSAPKYVLCDFQGISVGWADEYYDGLDGQFVDVTGLAHGQYMLESEVNAEWLYKETSYSNNRAAVPVTI
jgi:hypothetical protein